MRKLLSFLLCLFIGIGLAAAQTTKVSGVVISAEDGEPVIGASVVVKGTTTGTVTDFDGKFHLDVPSSSKFITVSYVGMKATEVAIKPSMRIILESDSEQLDEVMVVAYGTAKKSAFTGSASTVKSDQISMRAVSNVSNALSGQVAGVQVTNNNGQPGSEATIRVRGVGSMSASNSPLYVVDGVPFDGSISSINPQDIESMTVLKDAAANAIYGARGANGVVLITTKKANSKEAVISVDAKWGSNSRAVPNYEVMTDPGMYYENYYKALYNSKAYNGSSAADAYAFADKTIVDKSGLGYMVYNVPEGERFIGTNFKLNPNATLGYSDGDYYYTPDNWYDEMFNSGNLRQEYNVSVAGSTDKLNAYISVGYLDDSGIISNSGFNRYTGRVKLDYQAKDWLRVGANVGYTYYNMKSPTSQSSWGSSGNLFYVSNLIAPIYPMYVRNPDGSVKVDDRGITVYDFGGSSTNFTRAFMPLANPAITTKLDKYNAYNDVVNSKWYAVLTPIDGLSITANLGANVANERKN
ncbi:MAG: SusC/RagA family TonB-linked outer membrane protein, partial [Bacteroidales bacterium]